MNSKKVIWRTVVALAVITAVTIGAVSLLNVGGWRARVLSRIMRVDNWPVVVTPPPNFQPHVPPGFRVSVFARGFVGPRWLAVSPNGDVFVADSAAGEVIVLHGLSVQGSAESRAVFADHLKLPFGIAFHEDYVYIADTNEVLRFRYDPKSSMRLGDAEHILDLPGLGYNQHWTRSLAFSADGQKLFVSVGSQTNVGVESDPRRAAILVADLDGNNMRVYATGLRNAVGIACKPDSGDLWATVNERDDIGDDIPSDYFTHVRDHGFYGWPYAYGDRHPDNRVSPRPDLVSQTVMPDLLLGAHVAPLQFAFYDKQQFPPEYWHGAFIAEHGSWNRRIRSGYQVVFVPFRNGSPTGEPKPFFSGFVPDPAGKEVYGRMVGVAVAADGALLLSDDGGKLIWRVSFGPEYSSGVSE
ncbi:MAG: PQQ-dependent sugar dehydrogenase [Candidatus Sulfotelmatobacter sp.]